MREPRGEATLNKPRPSCAAGGSGSHVSIPALTATFRIGAFAREGPHLPVRDAAPENRAEPPFRKIRAEVR